MRFWISWYQPTEDYRPLTDPPNGAVLGWWNSGERCDDGAATLCAAVDAKTETSAKAAILKDWPEADGNWRFCEKREKDWRPNDRFPIEPYPWIKTRFAESQ